MDSSCFAEQLHAFSDACAIDLPGHGSPGSASSIAEFAESVIAYVAQNHLDDVILCGHSMGGAIALEAVLSQRFPVRACILLGSGARLRVAPSILEGLRSDFERTIATLAELFFAQPAREQIDFLVNAMRRTGQAQVLRDFSACDAFDVLDRLPEVGVPLLAVTGAADKLTPPKYAEALASRVPGAQARIIGGAGHLVMVERPEETNAALSAFQERVLCAEFQP